MFNKNLSLLFFVLTPLAFASEPAAVVVNSAKQMEFAPTIWVPGTLVSRNDVWIAAEVKGPIIQIVEPGSEVSKGEVLLTIDDFRYTSALAGQKAVIEKLKVEREFWRTQQIRLQKLASASSVSQRSVDEAKYQYDTASAQLAFEQTKLDSISHDLTRTKIESPFAGIVADRRTALGGFAEEGAPLLRLVDIYNKEIVTNVPTKYAHLFDAETAFQVKGENFSANARLRSKVPVADQESRTFQLRLGISDNRPIVGTSVQVAVPTALPRAAVAVPDDAIQQKGNDTFVQVVDSSNTIRTTLVTSGVTQDGWTEVEGFEPGTRIVVRGGVLVADGQSVRILDVNGN